MKKYIYLLVIVISLFSCSGDNGGGDSNSSKEIEFYEMYLGHDIWGDSIFYFLGKNLQVDRFDGMDYLFGEGWIMDLYVYANYNDNGLPEEGVYIKNGYSTLPPTLYEVSLFPYNSTNIDINGEHYLMSNGSSMEISYESGIMNITYSLLLRDSENGMDVVDLTINGEWSINISDIKKIDGEIELWPEF